MSTILETIVSFTKYFIGKSPYVPFVVVDSILEKIDRLQLQTADISTLRIFVFQILSCSRMWTINETTKKGADCHGASLSLKPTPISPDNTNSINATLHAWQRIFERKIRSRER